MSRFDKPPVHDETEESASDNRVSFIEKNTQRAQEFMVTDPALARGFLNHFITRQVDLKAPMRLVHAKTVSSGEQVFGPDKTEWPLPSILKLLPRRDCPADFLNEVRKLTEQGGFDLVETLAISARAGIQQSLYLRNPAEELAPPDNWAKVTTLREAVEVYGLPYMDEDILEASIQLISGLSADHNTIMDLVLVLNHSRPQLAIDTNAYSTFMTLLKSAEQEDVKEAIYRVGLSPPFSRTHLAQIEVLARQEEIEGVWKEIQALQTEYKKLAKFA